MRTGQAPLEFHKPFVPLQFFRPLLLWIESRFEFFRVFSGAFYIVHAPEINEGLRPYRRVRYPEGWGLPSGVESAKKTGCCPLKSNVDGISDDHGRQIDSTFQAPR